MSWDSSENSALSTRGQVYQHHLTKSTGQRIRIFDLQPAPSSSPNPIHGVLREISLDAGHKYDALSYVWGEDKHNPACIIYLGPVTPPVTRNGHDALKRLRHTTRTRSLWIDAICIDQSHAEERSHQVAMMLDIYRNADRVFAWLGKGTPKSDRAFDWCRDVSREAIPSISYKKFAGLPFFYNFWLIRACLENLYRHVRAAVLRLRPTCFRTEYRRDCMEDIFGREWFRRMWTVQELAMAKNPFIMCGEKAMPFAQLSDAINIFPPENGSDNRDYVKQSIMTLNFFWTVLMMRDITRNRLKQSLRRILPQFIVDRLLIIMILNSIIYYAFIAICGYLFGYAKGSEYLSYHFGFNVRDKTEGIYIYGTLAFTMLLRLIFRPLGVYTDMGMTQEVERMTRKSLSLMLLYMYDREATDPRDKVFAVFGLLKELGIDLDEPDYTEEPATVVCKYLLRLAKWEKSLDVFIKLSTYSPPKSPSWISHWSHPDIELFSRNYKASRNSEPRCTFKYYNNPIQTLYFLLTYGIQLGEVDEVFGKTEDEFSFKTRNGREDTSWTGYGLNIMQLGDHLVIISGLSVPVLLRRIECESEYDLGDIFVVVGAAVIDGIMKGEAWPENESELNVFIMV